MTEGITDVHVEGLCCVLDTICRKEASSGIREQGGNKAGEESNTEVMDETSEISYRKEREEDSVYF